LVILYLRVLAVSHAKSIQNRFAVVSFKSNAIPRDDFTGYSVLRVSHGTLKKAEVVEDIARSKKNV
jgi:hypothetical protein